MRKKAAVGLSITGFILVFAAMFWFTAARSTTGSAPEAVNGVLDLTDWNFDSGGVVRLDGEWEYYRSRLMTPEDLEAPSPAEKKPGMTGYVHVPELWERYKEGGAGGSPYGYATFRLRVELPEGSAGKIYGIRQTNIKTAHKLFVDGRVIGARGIPGVSKQETTSVNAPYVRFFAGKGNQADIIVQVANYRYFQGGITHPIFLGNQEDIQSMRELAVVKDLFATCGILLMGAYFLVLFWMRGHERSWFYFGLCCMAIAVYSMTHGEKIAAIIFPDLPYEIFTKAQDFSGVSAELFLLLYALHSFPNVFNKIALKAFGATVALRMILILLTPASFFSRISMASYAAAFLISLYVVYVMSVGALRRMEGSVYMLIGALSLLTMVVVHALEFLGVGTSFSIQLACWMCFVIAQWLLLSKRFVGAYAAVEKLTGRLRSMDRLKDEFLANTSHEMKTPLHGIINISRSLLDGAAGSMTPEQEKNIAMIMGIGKRMDNLVGDLLDFSKLKNGELVLKREAVALRPLVHVIFEMFRHLVGEKPVRFIEQLNDRQFVHADEDRLTQILINLIGNALKFTDAGEIVVTAREDNGWLAISVTDTGIGIAQDKLEVIFESFEQAGISQAREYGGAGLGLSIVRQLVELHGGYIHAVSEPGKGAVFVFTVPLAIGADELPVRRRKERTHARLDLANLHAASLETVRMEGNGVYTILIVDDDAANRQVLLNLLSVDSYTVIAVSNGMEAMRQLEQNRRIDLAVVDLMMPGMSGYELCRHIRKQYSLTELPVLLLTARNRPEELMAAFEAGVNDFLGKPVEAGELKARIRTLLNMKQSVSESISAEMAFLQAQIKPHFLFNALNTISAFSMYDPENARDLLAKLSRYLRGSFDFKNLERLVPLRTELELVEAYLSIEKARFGKRLQIVYDTQDVTDCMLPPLVIQPLVENAVRHGLANRKQGGTVAITIRETEQEVLIRVEDDGIGYEHSIQNKHREDRNTENGGVALKNIRQRLLRMYGRDLQITSKPSGGTVISISIPKGGSIHDSGYGG